MKYGKSRTSKTIPQFCQSHRFSEAFYYKMKRLGLGPRELQWGRCIRITDEAEDAWLLARSADAAAKSPAEAA
jgi:hypothetical protein